MKSLRFLLAKQQLCTCITLKGEREHIAQQFPFSFSKLRYGPFGFNPRKFPQHLTNEIKLNKFDEV